jgi:phytoene desaturase
MLSFHPLFIGANPSTTTSLYCLIAFLEQRFGVHFAMGGMGSMVAGLHKLLVRKGGQLRCNAEVRRVLLDGRRAVGVELTDGERIAADLVIANCDSATLYDRMLPDLPKKRWSRAKLARTKYSMSVFVWYFGTNRRYDAVPHHTIVLGPRYRELLRDIFLKKHLAEDFSLYLYRPTATDPSLAPAGCDSFYVLSPVPNLQGDVDWTTMAEPYRQAIERRLEERLLPGLSKAVVSSRITTPLDFRDRLNSLHGAAFGLEPLMLQSAWFRPTNRSENVRNLYLVGAGTHPGAGVSGVLMSARIVDGMLPHAHAFARQ